MLVQISLSNLETVGANFDETKNRVTPHMQYDNWKEFIVVWRKDRLEIYKDHVRVKVLTLLSTYNLLTSYLP